LQSYNYGGHAIALETIARAHGKDSAGAPLSPLCFDVCSCSVSCVTWRIAALARMPPRALAVEALAAPWPRRERAAPLPAVQLPSQARRRVGPQALLVPRQPSAVRPAAAGPVLVRRRAARPWLVAWPWPAARAAP
jgi:hypothetical protein